MEGRKRLIGTLDPDYVSPPDSKKIKLLQAKGEEEFYGRVVKVVDEQFLEAVNETNFQAEDFDEKILKIQQSLHTLRYSVSLNSYAFGKLKGRTVKDGDKTPQLNHPTIQRQLGNPPVSNESLPTSECLSAKNQKNKAQDDALPSTSTETVNKTCKKDSSKKEQESPSTDQNCRVIYQGRRGRFQKKVRLVIGNTYQYLSDSEGSEDRLKFKWRIYVRGPTENTDISSFITAVKFTLDKSYSPHDVITIREPPFSLSRRGWGEFKIYLELSFTDARNKPIQLLHPLTLSRTDDPLAFTGIWRLGKEIWYDIWLYDKTDESEACLDAPADVSQSKDEILSALQKKGLKSETIYSDGDGNMTLAHSFQKDKSVLTKEDPTHSSSIASATKDTESASASKGIENKLAGNDTENTPVTKVIGSVPASNGIENPPAGMVHCNGDSKTTNTKSLTQDLKMNPKVPPATPKAALPVFTNSENKDEKLCKIYIRQADGSLISWMMPKSMYNMALKFSNKNTSNSGPPNTCSAKANPPNTAQVQPPNGTSKKCLVAPNPLSSMALPSSPAPPRVKNGLVKRGAAPQANLPPPMLRVRGQTLTGPRLPGLQKAPGMLVRFNSVQKQVLPSSPGVLLSQARPTLIKIPESVLKAPAPPGMVPPPPASTLGPNSIRLAVNQMPPGNAGRLKATLLNEKLLSLKPPLASNGAGGGLGQIRLSKAATNPLPPPLTTPPPSLPPQEGAGGELSPSGKVTTRRIFISAPPHLVKLREAAVQKGGEEEGGKGKGGVKKPPEFELSPLEKYEQRKKFLRSTCQQHCSSVDEMLRVYLKGLPLFLQSADASDEALPFCAPSYAHFLSLSIGRRRAVEFWRGREIRKELKLLNAPDWQAWNAVKIVSWARKHAYTPFTRPSQLTVLEKRSSVGTAAGLPFSLAPLKGDLMASPGKKGKRIPSNAGDKDESIIVVDSEEEKEKEEEEKKKRQRGKEEKEGIQQGEQPCELHVMPEMAEVNHRIDLTLSKVRVKLEPEEVAPGVRMEAAKCVLWKATMSLMEDLLRAAHAEAATSNFSSTSTSTSTSSSTPNLPANDLSIDASMVLRALANGRSQFDLLSGKGLGKQQVFQSAPSLPPDGDL